MRQNDPSPHAAPKGLEEKLIYLTQKIISLWRADKEHASKWFLSRDPPLRVLLINVLKELATDQESLPGIRTDCRDMIIYFNAHYPTT